jgi:predicted esterase
MGVECVMQELMDFSRFQKEFFRLYYARTYEDALTWLRLGGGQFPEKAARLFYWRACISALLDRPNEAVKALQDGLDLGYWWTEDLLRKDPDLATLQARNDFISLLPLCDQRHRQAEAQNNPSVLIYPPTQFKGIEQQSSQPFPLLLGLHCRGCDAQSMAMPFIHLTEQGWIVAAVQSAQLDYPGAYAWNDRERARQDVLEMLVEIQKQYVVDRERIILAGFSQGGGLALEMSLSGAIPARGVIGIAPYLRQWEKYLPDHPDQPHPSRPDLRIVLITGEKDGGQAVFTSIEQLISLHHLDFLRDQHPNLGHDFPDDFPNVLDRALSFILK